MNSQHLSIQIWSLSVSLGDGLLCTIILVAFILTWDAAVNTLPHSEVSHFHTFFIENSETL